MNLLICEPSSRRPTRRPEPAIARGENVMLPGAWWVKVSWQSARPKWQPSLALFLRLLICSVQFKSQEGQKETQSHISCCGLSSLKSPRRQTDQQTRSSSFRTIPNRGEVGKGENYDAVRANRCGKCVPSSFVVPACSNHVALRVTSLPQSALPP
jgi:hypothetical protein